MKPLKPLLYLLTIMSLCGASYANRADGKTDFQQELDENDEEELLNFINAKRNIPLVDKSNYLSISGEVHAEWNYETEKQDGRNVKVYVFREDEQWGDTIYEEGDRIAIGRNNLDVQFDLYVDFKPTDRAWARSHLRFDNSCGVDDNGLDPHIDPQGYHGSGSRNNLALREAYVGYEIFKCGDDRLTIELGRRGNIYKVFYSELQFSSRLDGVILKYASKRGGFANWYVEAAGFVVDERSTHFAWAAEAGLLNIMDSGLDFRYSFIDWQKRGLNRFFIKDPIGMRFKVSQFSVGYTTSPQFLGGQPLHLFGAFLVNHIPANHTFIDLTPERAEYTPKRIKIHKQNLGGFFGLQYREIAHEGDWFLKAYAAYCQAQCIPDNDVRNIGTGNSQNDSFTSDGRGNVNWQGYSLKFGYALTEHFVIETQYDHSWNIKDIAGTHGYTRYVMETTYSF